MKAPTMHSCRCRNGNTVEIARLSNSKSMGQCVGSVDGVDIVRIKSGGPSRYERSQFRCGKVPLYSGLSSCGKREASPAHPRTGRGQIEVAPGMEENGCFHERS